MSTFNRLVLLVATAAVLGVSGCIVEPEQGPYRYEHGDRVDRYGHRDEHWCDYHHEDEHCH
jgi:hypothetical protein